MFGKETDAVERDIEWWFRDWGRQRRAYSLLDRRVGASKKVQRKVHAIGTDPRRLRVFLEWRA